MKKAELYSKLLQQLKDNNKSPDIIAAIEELLLKKLWLASWRNVKAVNPTSTPCTNHRLLLCRAGLLTQRPVLNILCVCI